MTTVAIILGLFAIAAYIWGDMHRFNAECYRQRIASHRAAAAAFVLEVRKLERRAQHLERRRYWVTRRAWARRSGYRRLGVWQARL